MVGHRQDLLHSFETFELRMAGVQALVIAGILVG